MPLRTDVRTTALACRLIGALVLALTVGGCGSGSQPGGEVALTDLVEHQEDHDGSVVSATGVVRTYDEPRHYWIEDEAMNRVEIVPAAAVEAHVGARVRVEGRFTFRDDQGRRIVVDRLEVLEPAPGGS